MKTSIRYWSIASLVVLGLCAGQDAVAAEREFSGEVVQVSAKENRLVLNVPDGVSAEGQRVTIRVDESTRLQGIEDLSELKEHERVQVEVKKGWFGRQWIADRLVYAPPQQQRTDMSPMMTSKLHQIEGEFAHGQMGDIEYETKRQDLQSQR